eukprot:Gb_14601 [translate_table: standard]
MVAAIYKEVKDWIRDVNLGQGFQFQANHSTMALDAFLLTFFRIREFAQLVNFSVEDYKVPAQGMDFKQAPITRNKHSQLPFYDHQGTEQASGEHIAPKEDEESVKQVDPLYNAGSQEISALEMLKLLRTSITTFHRHCDFGLARRNTNDNHVTRVLGTLGYLAPEYVESGIVTEKTDVYSFGIVLLQLISGRKVVDFSKPYDQQSLIQWVSYDGLLHVIIFICLKQLDL